MHKILVVDDDEEIGFMIKLMLEQKGFSVTVCVTAENKEEVVLQNNFSLILLDMLIAGTMGTDVCARLKSNPETATLPILMVTALPDIQKKCLEAGANDVLAKPFDMTDLISKTNFLIERSKISN
jgi:DNA-binding response OmpR family regulator